MLKSALFVFALSALASCNSHHGHGPDVQWLMDVTTGEEGVTNTMPVLMDDYVVGIPYSQVNFQAEAPAEHGKYMKRAFALYSTGEQRVSTELKCDLSKQNVQGEAGEASLTLLGSKVRFYCKF